MTLKKAIEELSELWEITFINKSPKRNSAVKLGIEALKAIDKLRDYEHHVYPTDLPGETKE